MKWIHSVVQTTGIKQCCQRCVLQVRIEALTGINCGDCQLSTVRNHTLLFQITQYSQVALFLPHQLLNCLIQTVPSDERQQVVFSYWNKKSLSWAKLFSDIVPKVMDIQYTRCSHCTVHTAQCTHNTLRRIIAADMKSELWLCANRCRE